MGDQIINGSLKVTKALEVYDDNYHNIKTRFTRSRLQRISSDPNDGTLAQNVFSNNTGKTLYIVCDITKNNKNTKRHLVNKGVKTMPWDLKRRRMCWKNAITIAPGESVPLWKLLMIPIDTLQSVYGSDIRTNSAIVTPQNDIPRNQDAKLFALHSLLENYTIGIRDSKVYVKNSCYYTNREHHGAKSRVFDLLFLTKNRTKCIYLVERDEHSKKVHIALNIKFGRMLSRDSKPCLTVTFHDINTFNYMETTRYSGK